MIKPLTESDNRLDKINDVLEKAHEIMSLGSGIGFRQISGIDVISSLESAVRTIERAKEELYGDDQDTTYAQLAYKNAVQYLRKANKASDQLRKDIDALLAGLDKISSVIFDILSEANTLI